LNKILSVLLLLLFFLGTIAYLNITFDYPLSKTCQKIKDYKVVNGQFPEMIDKIEGLENVKFMSVLEYQNKGDDFLLYFCPTRLGPCEV